MDNNTEAAIDGNPVIEAATQFRENREKAFEAMATTAKSAINYGTILEDVRNKLGSAKKLETWLVATLPDIPIQDSEACLKVAAKFHREGESLFLQRSGAAWAQAELGLLPPPPPKAKSQNGPLKPADALAAIERCKAKVVEVIADCPLEGWTEQETELCADAIAQLTSLTK